MNIRCISIYSPRLPRPLWALSAGDIRQTSLPPPHLAILLSGVAVVVVRCRTRLIVILKGFVYLLPISQDCNNLTSISLQTIRGQNCAVAFNMYFHLIYPHPHNCICISIFNVQYTQVTTLADTIPIINIVFCTTKNLEKDIFQCPESLHS